MRRFLCTVALCTQGCFGQGTDFERLSVPKIHSIKLWRFVTGRGLKEAKDAIEEMLKSEQTNFQETVCYTQVVLNIEQIKRYHDFMRDDNHASRLVGWFDLSVDEEVAPPKVPAKFDYGDDYDPWKNLEY